MRRWMIALGASVAMAGQTLAQDREISRVVEAEAFSFVSDDPLFDRDLVTSMEPGDFVESVSALAAIPPFASNRSRAEQTSVFEPDPDGDVIEASGSAVAQLFIQGSGDAYATSWYRVRFVTAASATLLIEDFELLVDRAFDGEVSRDRPGDAGASIRLHNTDTFEIEFEVEAVLDDIGTRLLLRPVAPIEVDLDPGAYELRIAATARDQTEGFEEVSDSLAAASYFFEATLFEAGACIADLDGDGALTLFDFLAFQTLFDAGDLAADFDGDDELTLFDFLAFQNAFDAGCP
ncbi:MAG: GC-type dockerin domain-anchored protein [Phycisphaerales bacterium]